MVPPASAQPHGTHAPRHPQHKTSRKVKHSTGRFMTQPTDATRTASGSPQWMSTDTLEAGRDSDRNLVTWISERLGTTHHRTPRIGSAQFFVTASWLHECQSTTCPLDSTALGPDDWWPAWHDPHTDTSSAESDSLPDLRDDESFMTTVATCSAPARRLPRFLLSFLHFPFSLCLLQLLLSSVQFGSPSQWVAWDPCLRQHVPHLSLRQIRHSRGQNWGCPVQ